MGIAIGLGELISKFYLSGFTILISLLLLLISKSLLKKHILHSLVLLQRSLDLCKFMFIMSLSKFINTQEE